MEDLLKQLRESLERAKKARPDIPPEDLLFSAFNDGSAPTSIDEINASGKEMVFLCMRASTIGAASVPSTREECDICHEDVWMSHGTMMTYSQIKKGVILCEVCGIEKLKKEEVTPPSEPSRPEEKSGPTG